MDSEKFIQNFNTILSLFLFKKKKIFPFHIKAKKDAGIISYFFFFKFQISNFKFQISNFKFQNSNSNFNLKKNPLDVCVCFLFLRLLFLARSVRHSVNCYRSYKKIICCKPQW